MREESANVQYCNPDCSLEFVKSLGSYFRKKFLEKMRGKVAGGAASKERDFFCYIL